MEVLLMEGEGPRGRRVEQELRAAGHTVRRCHEPDEPVFPCAALQAGSQCPLEERRVDVALVFRHRPSPKPAVSEQGVTCALRVGVPVVVAGRASLNPFAAHATLVVDNGGDLAAACERAVADTSADEAAVENAVTRALAESDRSGRCAAVCVRRRPGGFAVTIEVESAASPAAMPGAVDAAARTMRARHPLARTVDVAVSPITAPEPEGGR